MSSRVLFCPGEPREFFPASTFAELGRLEDGSAWGALPDRVIVADPRTAALPLLYFSEADYAHAVRDLSHDDVREVIRKRLRSWSSDALSEARQEIYRGERANLAVAAWARAAAPPERRALHDEHFAHTIARLERLSNEGRYQDLGAAEMMGLTAEGQAGLLAETEDVLATLAAPDAGATGAELTALREAVAREADAARALDAAHAKLDKRPDEGLLLRVPIERGVFVAPADRALFGWIEAAQRGFVPWRDGVVTTMPVHTIPSMREVGRRVVVLYLDAAELMDDESALTRAQVTRSFEDRARAGVTPRAAFDHLHALRLEQVLLWHHALSLAPLKTHKRKRDALTHAAAQLREAVEALRASLATHPTWLPDIAARGSRVVALRDTLEAVTRDTAFFAALARLRGDGACAAEFDALTTTRQEDLSWLDARTGAPRR